VNDWWLFSVSLPSPYDSVPEQGHLRAITLAWILFGCFAYLAAQSIAARKGWPFRGAIAAAGPIAACIIGTSWLMSAALFTARIWDAQAEQRSVAQSLLAGPVLSWWHTLANRVLLAAGAFGTAAPSDWSGTGSSNHAPPDYLFIGLVADLTLAMISVTAVMGLLSWRRARRG
jgi:hypothetical protein